MAQMYIWRRVRDLVGGGVVLAALLVIGACSSSLTAGTAATSTPSTTSTASATSATPTTPSTGYPIKVFFTKAPESDGGYPIKVFPVNRVSPTQQVETYSVQLLIAGPTPEERAAGYYSEFNSLFSGTSQCSSRGLGGVGGPDFTLTLNMKGGTPEQGTATLKFCRVSHSGGIGVDARVLAQLNATLLQFATIKKVAILNLDGNCFGDMTTQNECLK